jgi:hypothetical protein
MDEYERSELEQELKRDKECDTWTSRCYGLREMIAVKVYYCRFLRPVAKLKK